MAYTSEIEKLERRYAENPKGRNFAPLADAYRKAGQLDQAIELCKSGLDRHPDYVSAHIVYGRCLLDKKDDPGAESAFRKVLDLDPENVIAFKVLAELGERGKRYDDQVQWLTRLLTADPMNGDAADALTVAKRRAAEQAAAAPPPAPVARTVPEMPAVEPALVDTAVIETEPAAIEPERFVLERASVVTKLPDAPPAAPPPEPEPADLGGALETFDGRIGFDGAKATTGTEGIELQDEMTLTPANLVVEGLARTQYEGSGMFKLETPPPPDPATSAPEPARPMAAREVAPPPGSVSVEEPLEELPTVDLPLIMPEDVVPPRRTRATPPPPAPLAPPPAPRPVPRREIPPDDDGAADTAALSKVEPVVTETMAELYLRQGHTEDAVRVYEALLAQRPADRRLQEKLDGLTGRGDSGQSIRAFLHALFTGQRPDASVAPGQMPADSSLSGAFAAAPTDGEMPGEPSHATDDALSLDQVFGDDPRVSQSMEPEAPEPAPPPPPRKAPEPVGQRTAGFSFDEFFNANSAPAPQAASPAASVPARPSVRVKAAAEDEADLDQFQAWLKGLKA